MTAIEIFTTQMCAASIGAGITALLIAFEELGPHTYNKIETEKPYKNYEKPQQQKI